MNTARDADGDDTCVHTVGIGRSSGVGGCSLADLERHVRQLREHYDAPDDTHVHSTAPGDIYVAEVSWIGPVRDTGKVLPPEMVRLWTRDPADDTPEARRPAGTLR